MRIGRGWLGLLLALGATLGHAAPGAAGGEAPTLGKLVAAGKLPPLAQRLPERPRVLATDPAAVYGGELRMLIGTLKDKRELEIVRGAAYEALLLLFSNNRFPPANRDIDLSRDVDWKWIDAIWEASIE